MRSKSLQRIRDVLGLLTQLPGDDVSGEVVPDRAQ